MAEKDRSIRRKKPNKRIRGTPMFDAPKAKEPSTKDLVMEPETSMDIARLLADEIIKKWPDAKIPTAIAGKHVKFAKDVVAEFDSSTIKSMIRVLVWDFEEIKKNKAFFPPCNHLTWPWIDQLYHYRLALAGAVGSGITDATSRTSAYAQKYLSNSSTSSDEKSQPQGESMKDIAKRLLGQ